MPEQRIQKIIANAGISSRRKAEEMIREGRVTVNGRVVDELGSKADPDRDHIKIDGKLVTRTESKRYILLNKPKEVMTTVEDPQGRPTVLDFIKGVRERIYPVGRLDYHSEGLVLLTNDGELAFQVAHPKHGSVKTYHVKVRGVPAERMIEKLQRGITIDGRRTLPSEIARLRTTGRTDDEGNSWFEVRLREGRTQQIRKMFQAVGHPVAKLKRVAIGPISDSSLSSGKWRELSEHEVKLLRKIGDEPARPRRPARRRAATEPASEKRKRPAATKRTTARKSPARKSAAGTSRTSGHKSRSTGRSGSKRKS
ncbi:MAG: pseudouridine synthase [Thermoanaerobaculia bacterium]